MPIENTFGMNIIPDNDPERLQALYKYQLLDTPSEATFDNIAKLAAQIFKVPIALISLVDAERVFFKANIGMGAAKNVDRGKSLCSLAVLEPGVTVFEDALKEPCLIANPNVAGDFGLRFYAGAPITTSDGFMIGTLCVIDKQPREFSEDNRNVLAGLAGLIIDQVEQRLSAINEQVKLSDSEEELAAMNEELVSINEELSSGNEELTLINEQLNQSKNELGILAEQLLYVTNTIPQQVWTATPDGMLDFVNSQTTNYFGKHADELTGEKWLNVVHPDDLESAGKAWGHSITSGDPYQIEFRLLSKDNIYVWHMARAIAYKENGKIIKWFGTNTDIDGHKQLVQHKNDFISIASHELKTPVTSLKASLQLLDKIKNQPSVELLPKLIEQSNRGIKKISALIDDLLSVSRVSEGQMHVKKALFNVQHMLHESSSHLKAEGTHEIVFEGNLSADIFGDQRLIEQVVVNFINNVVKYAPQSKTIAIEVINHNQFVKIAVKDTGPGIPENKIPHLFDRYYRVDHSGQQYSGLGLGLYISSEIIKRQGGQIGVDSKIGEGSTFWFTIPV